MLLRHYFTQCVSTEHMERWTLSFRIYIMNSCRYHANNYSITLVNCSIMKPTSDSQNLTINYLELILLRDRDKVHKCGQRPLLEPISGQGIML